MIKTFVGILTFTALLIVVSSCESIGYSKYQDETLHGKVRSVRTETYHFNTINSVLIDSLLVKKTLSNYQNNRIIEDFYYFAKMNRSRRYVYKYCYVKPKYKVYLYENDSLQYVSHYFLSGENKPIRIENYIRDSLSNFITYEYYDNILLISGFLGDSTEQYKQHICKDDSSRITSVTTTSMIFENEFKVLYDNYAGRYPQKTLSISPSKDTIINKFNYTYDSYGNWVTKEKEVSGIKKEVTLREISYQ